jgi:hydrogenase maturation protease
MSDTKNILILGLGNDCLGDDAVGPRVARRLRRQLLENQTADGDHRDGAQKGIRAAGTGDGVDIVETSAGGMVLLDLMSGYRGLILIDAIQTAGGEPGLIHRLNENQLPAASGKNAAAPWSAHHLGLRQLLEAGRRAGYDLPRTVVIYAVETDPPREWCRGCSPPIERAIPEVVRRVVGEIPAMTAENVLHRGSH